MMRVIRQADVRTFDLVRVIDCDGTLTYCGNMALILSIGGLQPDALDGSYHSFRQLIVLVNGMVGRWSLRDTDVIELWGRIDVRDTDVIELWGRTDVR